MQLKVKEIERVYTKLKMVVRSAHHKLAYFYFQGKLILKTRLSHGSGDVKAAHKIRGDFHLNEKDFQDLVNCPLSYEGYIQILKEKGVITN